jgi:hypothetical protein
MTTEQAIMMNLKRNVAWLVCGMVAIGCEDAQRPRDVPIAKAPALEAVSESPTKKDDKPKTEPYEATVAGFKFTVPADWQEQPPKSQFVLGEFSIPGEGGPARLTLSSAGGGIEANVERWRGQFNPGPNDPEPRESEITLDGNKGTLVELAGTYTDMFSGGTPNRSWRMLGVAVPMGPTNYFVKLTGPAAILTARREEFVKFVESARQVK